MTFMHGLGKKPKLTDVVCMKILVVHRQKEVVENIKLVLRQSEPAVRFTDSGLDGLLVARIESFDLVICSTDLPVITGFELVRSIRTNSINKHVEIILIADQIGHKEEHLAKLNLSGIVKLSDLPEKLLAFSQKLEKVQL